jgi:hypothetical protein
MKSCFFLIIFCIGIVSNLQAQSSSELEIAYKAHIPLHQEIVSGGYYVDPPHEIEGDPYFISKNFEYSTITVNGLTYEKVPLLYNIFTDEVIIFHPIHKQKTLLKTDKIDAFVLPENKSFIRIKENPEYSHHNNGFYELVEKGEKGNLLCKHFKTTKVKREISKYNSVFVEKLDFLIQKSDTIHLVKNRGKSIEFLGLDKKEIKKKSREIGLDFRNDRRSYLAFLVETFNLTSNE